MRWNLKSVMEQKILFIKILKSEDYNISLLCKHYGISRPSGYKLTKQFKEQGEKCFNSKSKAPHIIPHKMPKKVESEIVKLRKIYVQTVSLDEQHIIGCALVALR